MAQEIWWCPVYAWEITGVKVLSQKTFWNFWYICSPIKILIPMLKAWYLETAFNHIGKRHAPLPFITGDWGGWLKINQSCWWKYFDIFSLYTLQQWVPDPSSWCTATTLYLLPSYIYIRSASISGIILSRYAVIRDIFGFFSVLYLITSDTNHFSSDVMCT